MPAPTEIPTYIDVIKTFLDFGTNGVLLIIVYFFMHQVQEILRGYAKDMAEQRQMYANNVELVKQYEQIATDLKEIIVLNTQTLTRLTERIKP